MKYSIFPFLLLALQKKKKVETTVEKEVEKTQPIPENSRTKELGLK